MLHSALESAWWSSLSGLRQPVELPFRCPTTARNRGGAQASCQSTNRGPGARGPRQSQDNSLLSWRGSAVGSPPPGSEGGIKCSFGLFEAKTLEFRQGWLGAGISPGTDLGSLDLGGRCLDEGTLLTNSLQAEFCSFSLPARMSLAYKQGDWRHSGIPTKVALSPSQLCQLSSWGGNTKSPYVAVCHTNTCGSAAGP